MNSALEERQSADRLHQLALSTPEIAVNPQLSVGEPAEVAPLDDFLAENLCLPQPVDSSDQTISKVIEAIDEGVKETVSSSVEDDINSLRKFPCIHCEQQFNTLDILTAHLNLKHSNNLTTCRFCRDTFTSFQNLKTHVRNHHVGERRFMCKICDRRFSQNSSLKRHLIAIHEGSKLFKCQVCDKEFSEKSKLSDHTRWHNKEFTHVCCVCDKKFYQSSNLNRHMRLHTGVKPYVCIKCSKSFADSSTLNKHYRVHSVFKPYNCGCCEKGFSTAKLLKAHEKTH